MTWKRVDDNQALIVKALRKEGMTVQHLHAVGDGCPDLLVGFNGKNALLEVKDGDKPPSARKLTPDQKIWHHNWNGHKSIVTDAESAIKEVKDACK